MTPISPMIHKPLETLPKNCLLLECARSEVNDLRSLGGAPAPLKLRECLYYLYSPKNAVFKNF